MVEADVTGLVAFRDTHREAFERSMGVPLTFLPFAAMAVAQALQDNPMLNGRWDGDHVTLNRRVHLGIAVSTEGGLIVPVVHEADLLNVEGLAVKINEIVQAARSGTLKLDDVQGGTFTLNNTGALGSVISAPIINHPQAAIMTTEAIIKRPVVVESDAIAAHSMMNLCMTFDHRVCDGAEAGRFLADVKSRLESIDHDSQLL
jgi:2-oxoisovalerate dehydrogenase E2 component (dihydrolipoyl transacylase)